MTGSASALQGHCESKVSEERLVIRGETGWDKVLFSFQRGQIANGQTANTGSLALLAPGRQISGHLPASGFIAKNRTAPNTFHLVLFVVLVQI